MYYTMSFKTWFPVLHYYLDPCVIKVIFKSTVQLYWLEIAGMSSAYQLVQAIPRYCKLGNFRQAFIFAKLRMYVYLIVVFVVVVFFKKTFTKCPFPVHLFFVV